MSDDISLFTLPNTVPIVELDCKNAFDALTPKEKIYAHYLSRAAWNGGLIVLMQTSPESPLIFALLHKVFLAEPIVELKRKVLDVGIKGDEFTAFLVYACGVYSNVGNYQSHGDSKIIPNLPKEKFEMIMKNSNAYKEDGSSVQSLWNKIHDAIFTIDDRVKTLGYGNKGVTTYFSPNCTVEDADLVKEYMISKGLGFFNTRCFKENINEDNYRCRYEIKLASVETGEDPKITHSEEVFKGALFKVTRGDYNSLLSSVVENLKKAKEHASKDMEVQMLNKYIEHFITGSLEEHVNGSRYWVKNKSPVIETYIGFVETYRDPAGQRGEFEAFVAMVNPEVSKKFSALVNNAEELLALLPWGKDFEKDTFTMPDFTSVEVLTFAGSTIWSGENIPNYDQIRQSEGLKNLSFANTIYARMKRDSIPFLSEGDEALMKRLNVTAFDVQVGLHELFGHGSGKLLQELDDGSLNFDVNKIRNPINGEPITKYYRKGESYRSVFGPLGSAYEECKSEAVGLYLCLDKDVLKIFGYEGSTADDIVYVNWLSILWNGCARALEVYQPVSKKWMQAHSRARFVLLQVCLEAGEGLVSVTETEEGKNLRLSMDRSKIHTVGKKAVGDFLKKLQVYKSTADIEAAKKMFDKYSEVPEDGPHPWAKWREIVLAHKQPGKILVQANTFLDESGNVNLKNYSANFEGFIQSWI